MGEFDKGICAIAKVISNSHEKVLVVSGTLNHEVWESQKVTDAIKRAVDQKVKFDVIVGPEYDEESTCILEASKDSIWVASEWPEHHFMVGDDKHIRYERDHKKSESVPAVSNMIALDMPAIAEYLTARFYELKPYCKPLTGIEAMLERKRMGVA